jgi:hypothetical protein
VGGEGFLLTFENHLASDHALINVEFSTDLVTWTAATEQDLVAIDHQGAGRAAQKWLSPFPVASNPLQFARVRVELR